MAFECPRRSSPPSPMFDADTGLNWLANPTPTGLQRSYGIMVNYLYPLDEIETNHEGYRGAGEIAAAATVRALIDLR